MSDKFTATADIIINKPKEEVWDALIDPRKVKMYFFNVDLVTDWKVGSPIAYRGEWEGKKFEDKGTVLQVKYAEMLETNYWSQSLGEDKPENYQIVRYDLEPVDGGTKLTVTQSNAPSQESADHSTQNWLMMLNNMKKLLETGNS